jgi:DNA-binding transcriptional ArsR family regulator
MENYLPPSLDRTFAALGDPTRREILSRLEQDRSLSVSALAQPLPIKLPTVLKHLNVLSDAGLIRRTKCGRTVTVEILPDPLRDAMEWLSRYERFWSSSLDRLAVYAEARMAEREGKGE